MDLITASIPFVAPIVQVYQTIAQQIEIRRMPTGSLLAINEKILVIRQKLKIQENACLGGLLQVFISSIVSLYARSFFKSTIFYIISLVTTAVSIGTLVFSTYNYRSQQKGMYRIQEILLKHFQHNVSKAFDEFQKEYKAKFENLGKLTERQLIRFKNQCNPGSLLPSQDVKIVYDCLVIYSASNPHVPDMYPRSGKNTPLSTLQNSISHLQIGLNSLKENIAGPIPQEMQKYIDSKFCRYTLTIQQRAENVNEVYKTLEKNMDLFLKHNYVFA